ncbi:MAG: L-2-hydroxyglutarate oxidase, partial [Acidobacteriia bacterium]|nr:L-2-hydroxyglutarate oxidase [Terriglobia bacterium]
MYNFVVIGGGIVGLATARSLQRRFPEAKLLVIEKEKEWAHHQTGRNSGVIHSGIYYKPGSLKARMARQGNCSMVEFCRKNNIEHDICGKLIVASDNSELPRLHALYQRGLENGLSVSLLAPEQVKEIEPHVRCAGAIQVPSTGIVDYKAVCHAIARELLGNGAELRLATKATGLRRTPSAAIVNSDAEEFDTEYVINCAGLHSDRIAKMSGSATVPARIVPFRGEYYELKPERRSLVKNLIYPVPDPNFPFLGVHFTRMIDGSVHAGPNAVLSLKREGYRKFSFNFQDCFETLTYAGFWRLAARNSSEGLREVWRSFSKPAFTKSLQRLIPEVQCGDLIPASSGVRAQA